MIKKIILFNLICLASYSYLHLQSTDPFYQQTFNEGKELFLAKQYQKALDNFEIAAFGLHDNPSLLAQVYAYQVLINYRLKQIDAVKTIIKKIVDECKITEANQIPLMTPVVSEFKQIWDIYARDDSQKKETAPPFKSNINEIDFNEVFYQSLQHLKQNDLARVEKNIDQLTRLNKNDPRISYLKGRIAFNQKKYLQSLKYWQDIEANLSEELQNNLYYYLVLSYFFVDQTGQSLFYYQKIKDADLQVKLASIVDKAREIRKNAIDNMGKQYSKKTLKQALKEYFNDPSISSEIFQAVLKLENKDLPLIEDVIDTCLNYPTAYDQNFIITIISFLKNQEEPKTAVNIIEKCKYHGRYNSQSIEIAFQLALLYLEVKRDDKAWQMLMTVNNIQKNYRNCQEIIDKMGKNKYN